MDGKMNTEPVAWMDYLEHSDVYDLNVSGRGVPLYTHPHPDNLGLALSIIDQQKLEIEALKAHPVKEFFEDEPQAEELHEIMQSNTHPVKDLEDIDINITWNENSMRDFGKDELNFARAILRKAQE